MNLLLGIVLLNLFLLNSRCIGAKPKPDSNHSPGKYDDNQKKFINKYVQIWKTGMDSAKEWKRPKKAKKVKYDPLSDEACGKANKATEHDYIIIGGGSSGAVMAGRLADNPLLDILVLEAGDPESELGQIPGAYMLIQESDDKWGFVTTTQNYSCLAMPDQECTFDMAKVLGGESATNDNAYVRPRPADLDSWGLENWTFKKTLPFFKKMEALHDVDTPVNQDLRGTDGAISITHSTPFDPLMQAAVDAHTQSGYPYSDYNTDSVPSVSKIQVTTEFGRRDSVNKVYIQPRIDKNNAEEFRRNLEVKTGALVLRIIFEDQKAIGVNFLLNDKCFFARATKEVILSAGTINSPQILMVSGVGPRDELESLGIDMVLHSPAVGQNLQEHLTYFGIKFSTSINNPQPSFEESVYQYMNGYGSFATTYAEVIAFRNSQNSDKYPSIEILHSRFKNLTTPALVNKRKNAEALNTPDFKFSDIFTHVILLHPKSTGTVKLASADPTVYPLIDPRYLEHPDDLETMLQGILEVEALLQTPALKAINATLDGAKLPACQELTDKSEKWKCKIKHLASGINHAVGTCSMGDDPNSSVVDQFGRVHGVQNLRIVDASIIPKITSGHSNVVATMIAEKIAASIVDDQ